MTKQEKRRAQLDAIKVLKLMNSGKATTEEALKMAIPMIDSKPTEYTKKRRRRAANEVRKAVAAKMYSEDYAKSVKKARKSKKANLTDLQKRTRRARRMVKFHRLTARQRAGLSKGYSARQVVRQWTPIGSKTYKARITRLRNGYELSAELLAEVSHEAEYLTAGQIAKKYHIDKKQPPHGVDYIDDFPADDWETFTDVRDVGAKSIPWDTLVAKFGEYIRGHEIERPSRSGHSSGFFLYDNDFFNEKSVNDIESKGKYETLEVAKNTILTKVFGDKYIYVSDTDDGTDGIVLLREEWEDVFELADDWTVSLQYKPGGKVLSEKLAEGVWEDSMPEN